MKEKSTLTLKAIFILSCLGLVFMAAGIFAWGFYQPESPGTRVSQPRPVKFLTIEKRAALEKRTFPGLVHAAGETNLAFRVGGPLHAFGVVTGQKVKKGEVIARIDPRDFNVTITRLNAALEEASANLKAMENGARKEDIAALEAQVASANANLMRSQSQLNRFDQLIGQQFITTAQHDQAVADFKTCKAAYETAIQNLEKAKNGARKEDVLAAKARIKQLSASLEAGTHALTDTFLTAPFDGIINNRFVEKYETIKAGQPIVSLLDMEAIDVKVVIPEEMMLKRAVFTKISCILDAYPGMVFPASIKELGLKTSKANQSFPLTVSLNIPGKIEIQPGMTASLEIEYPQEDSATPGILLPAGSVFADSGGQAWVWKIDPVTHTVSGICITTDRIKEDKVMVMTGLHSGDLIVTAGARFLIQGQAVRLLEDSKGYKK